MSRLRTIRLAHAAALFALWAQLLWPALTMAGGPDGMPICTGSGLRVIADPAVPAPAVVHDCPCCVVHAQAGLPGPEHPALRLPRAFDADLWLPRGSLAALSVDYRRPWGRAPPVT